MTDSEVEVKETSNLDNEFINILNSFIRSEIIGVQVCTHITTGVS